MPLDRGRRRTVEELADPDGTLAGAARLRAVLVAIGIAVIVTALCVAVGLLVGQAFFGTTGGVL